MSELSDEDVGLLSDDQVGVGGSEPVTSNSLSDADVGLMSDAQVGIDDGTPAPLPQADGRRQAETPFVSGVREALHGAIPAVVGTIAAGAGTVLGGAAGTAVAPGPGTVAGGIAGGVGGFVGGSMAAEYGQDKALKALGFDDDEQRAANAAANPKSTFVGGLAPAVATMNPVAAGEKLSQRLVQRGVGGAMMGGFEAGSEAVQGQDLDPTKIAISTAVGVAAPSFNRGGKALADLGERGAQRIVPGRPGRTANPEADTAHQAVSSEEPVDPHASALAEPPPSMGEAQQATTGNPQSAPARSERDYGKGKAPLGAEGDMLTQGDTAPDVAAALKEAVPAEPAPQPAPPPKAAAAINQSKGRLGLKSRPPAEQPGEGPTGNLGNPQLAPEEVARVQREAAAPVADTGFPKEGEPVAVGENEATKMPTIKGETPINASITEGQKAAGNYPKARTHDFGKPQKIETHAGDERTGTAPDGTKWANKADYDYGYFNKTIGKDKDHVDFARPPEGSPDLGDKHFIIDQKNPDTGKFDEHKAFIYYKDEATARRAYESGFSDGRGGERLGAIKEVSRPELVKELAKHTSKPWNKPYSMAEETTTTKVPKVVEQARKMMVDQGLPKEALDRFDAMEPGARAAEATKFVNAKNSRTGVVKSAEVTRIRPAPAEVPGLLTAEGKPVTARTKADAQAKGEAHRKVVDWFEGSKPPSQMDLSKETNGELLDRIKPINDAWTQEGWKPAHKPAEWLWAREASKLLKKPTPEAIKRFRDAERLLRGAPEDVENYRGGNRVEADIARSKRGGDEAVANAEAKNIELGRNTAEDEMIAAIDAKRGGRFDVPHEEAESMVKPKPVKSAADLEELPRKTVSAKDSDLAKIDTNAISKKVLSDADAALVGRKPAKANVESEGAASPVRKIKVVDENEKARLLAALNKAATKKGAEVDALPPERDPDAVPKRFTDLFDKFASDEAGSMNIGKIKADVKRLMGTLTKTTDHKSYIAAESKGAMDDYARSLGEDFQRIRGEDTNHQLRMQQEASKLPAELNNPKALEEIYHAREADSAGIKPKNGAASNLDNLDPALKALYDQHLKPIFDQNDTIAAAIRQAFPDRIGADVQHHIQRLRKGDTPDFNMLLSRDDPTSPLYNGLMVNAKAAQDRKFYALERVADGRRTIIAPTEAGFDTHVKGKIQRIKDPNFEFEAGKAYKAGPVDYVMRQATTREIEKHVLDQNKKPMEYYHNAGFSAATTNLQLGSMLRHLEALEAIKKNPEFQKLSTTSEGKAKKEGWEEPNLPNFKGFYVHPAVKAALDDYAGIPQSAIRRLSAAVTKTLFWMPTAHINNVGAHWLSARGFDNFTPQGMKRLMETAPEAFKSVINQDAYQMKMRENGAGLIYGGVLTRDPVQKMARVFQMDMKANPSKYGKIADTLGVPLKALTGSIYDNASKVMWSVNDVLLTQRVMELEKTGKSMRQAIIDAERDIPNYRLPIKIMGSRWLQQQLADPVKVAFGRYHYGMFNSYANQFKDLLGSKATMGDRVEAAGRLMVTGMLLTVLYPMIWDKGAKLLTGNEDAKAQRRGPAAIPDKIIDALHGKTDLMAAARSSLTLPPLTTTALETLQNRDFRGKPIVEPGDLGGSATQKGRAAVKFGAHIAKGLVSPLSTISTNVQKDVSPLGAIRDQATDVKNPSAKAVKYERLIGMHNQRDTVQRFKKGGVDPIEGLYNKLFGYK